MSKDKEKRKQYYLANKARENANAKIWYQKHRESEIAKNAEYRKQNKELFNWYHNKQRFSGLKIFILQRDKNQCLLCDIKEKLVVHHIDGIGYKNNQISNNTVENLITLCRQCHSALHHWQKKNRELKSKEDIVRTLVKPRERHHYGVIRKSFIYGD